MYHIQSLTDFDKPVKTTLPEIVELIRSDANIQKVCERVRKSANKKEQQKIKYELPAFVLGEFDGDITNKSFVKTEYLLFDIDHIDKVEIKRLRTALTHIAILMFVSPSGNGLKFAIKLQNIVDAENYKGNYEHYANYFSDLMGVELDKQTKDPARKCYYSHDPEVAINHEAQVFPVAKLDIIQRVDNVDEISIDPDEITDCCTYLKDCKLSYNEWTMCAMALQRRDGGVQNFTILSTNKYYNDTEETIKAKFRQCGKAEKITLGTLFWLAMEKGYKRQRKFLLKGGNKYPFEVLQNGSHYRDKKDVYTWVFGWSIIEYLYDIRAYKSRDGDLQSMASVDSEIELLTRLRIDGKEITIRTASLSSATALKKEIGSKVSFHICHSKADVWFNMLSEYLHKTKPNAEVTSVKGVGKLLPNLWNWGNYVIMDGNIYNYEEIIWTSDKGGYMLEDFSKFIQVTPNPNIKEKLKRLHYFYGDQISVALGWAIANLFFVDIMRDVESFPILYLFGDTGKGKTKLGSLILAMFGVRNPNNSKKFHRNFSNVTGVAAGRIRSEVQSFPVFFDEYHTGHKETLKSYYDGQGRSTGIKDNTNRTKETEVPGGTISAAMVKPGDKEVINRCVYINIDTAVDDRKAPEFNDEFIDDSAHDQLSALCISIAVKDYYERYKEIYKQAFHYFKDQLQKTNQAGGRIGQNYAVVYAGYKLLVNLKIIPEWTELSDWMGYVTDAIGFSNDIDITEAFIRYARKFANDGAGKSYVRIDDNPSYDEFGKQLIRLTIFPQFILAEIQNKAMTERKNQDLWDIGIADLKSRLKKHQYFIETIPKKRLFPNWKDEPSNDYSTAFVFDIPIDADEELPF